MVTIQIKPLQQSFHEILLTLQVTKHGSVTIQVKPFQQYFHMVLSVF